MLAKQDPSELPALIGHRKKNDWRNISISLIDRRPPRRNQKLKLNALFARSPIFRQRLPPTLPCLRAVWKEYWTQAGAGSSLQLNLCPARLEQRFQQGTQRRLRRRSKGICPKRQARHL